MANFYFSVCAALGASLVTILAAVKGVWIVALVFGLLAVGFIVRAGERKRQ